MKAIKFVDNDIQYTESADVPQLTQRFNVLVKVHFAGICRTDIGIANGVIEHASNIVLGHEFCGTIVDIYNGEDLNRWHKGMAVSCNPMMFGNDHTDCMCGKDCDGAFAEYIAVPSSALVALPEHLLSPLGAYLEPVAAALAPFRFVPCYSELIRCCVFGDNRIAELTQLIGNHLGLKNVDLLKRTQDLGPCKYDYIIETEPQYIDNYIDALKPGGTLILKSRAFTPCTLTPNEVAMKEITIRGARYGDFDEATRILASTSRGEIGSLCCDNLLGSVYDLSEYESAFAEAQKNHSKKIFFRICAE